MDNYDVYDGYDDDDVVTLDLVEGVSPFGLDANLIERIAPSPSPDDNFEDIDLARLELNGLSDHSAWYVLAAPFFKCLAPIRVLCPLFSPTREMLNEKAYDFVSLIGCQYGACVDLVFFSFEFSLEREFSTEGVLQLSYLYDLVSNNLSLVPGLRFFLLSSDPVSSVASRFIIFGAAEDSALLGISSAFARIVDVFSEFDDCVLESFKITQESNYLESFLYFAISKHQHQWYRYTFVGDPGSATFLNFFVEDMRDWLVQYCTLYGERPFCGRIDIV